MSNYIFRARDKKTDAEKTVYAFDDQFGRHRYGYQVDDKMHTEEEFHAAYEEIATI